MREPIERGPAGFARAVGLLLWVGVWLMPTGLAAAGDGDEDRIDCRTAIEEVYWRYRTWPESNAGAKPPLASVLPREAVAKRIDDAARASGALAELWNDPVTPEQLQAEIDRMARQTRRPAMLRELFAAVGNDPVEVAECLARPLLAQRRLRAAYAWDARIHGEVRQQARAEVAAARGWDDLRSGTAEMSEIDLVRGEAGVERTSAPGEIELGEEAWRVQVARLGRALARPTRPLDELSTAPPRASAAAALPAGRLTPLRETEEGFEVEVVLSAEPDRLRLGRALWAKRDFDDWWAEARDQFAPAPAVSGAELRLPDAALVDEAPAAWMACTADTWREIGSAPEGRFDQSVVWTGSEMIVWGGSSSSFAFLSSGGRYDPTTDSWEVTSLTNAPGARSGHTAVWNGARMIVWGGWGGAVLATGGRYDPVSDSWSATSGSGAPAARQYHTAVWTGAVMIVWGGGSSGGSALQSGGRYDPIGDSWTPTNVGTAPSVRRMHSAVWTGNSMIVWGGGDGSGNDLSTGGRYDPAADSWLPTPSPGAPSARHGHSAVWTGSRMIVWGGDGPTGELATGARYDPVANSWLPTSMTAPPAARAGHTVVWSGSRMIVWGGHSSALGYLATGGRYDPNTDTWAPTSTTGAPVGRMAHSAVFATTTGRMIVWGGSDDLSTGHCPTAGGIYDPVGDTWTPTTSAPAPAARAEHTAVWTGAEMVTWGGLGAAGKLASGGRWDPATGAWAPTSTSGAPAARNSHTAVWTGTKMVIWGGSGAVAPYLLSTGGSYDPQADLWSATTPSGAPEARSDHTAVWTGNRMVVWGGYGLSGLLSNGGRYDPAGDSWAPTATPGAPSPRDQHSAVWCGGRMIVWGGYDGVSRLDSGGRYDPVADTWAATSSSGSPSARSHHGAVSTGTRMIVWGGTTVPGFPVTGGRYQPATDTWTPTPTQGAPVGREGHSTIWTGREMVVWGGTNGQLLPSGGRYDPTANLWAEVPESGAPSGRLSHSAVWTGTEMAVWGGWDGDEVDTGGAYCIAGDPAIFADGFESGNTWAWSAASP